MSSNLHGSILYIKVCNKLSREKGIEFDDQERNQPIIIKYFSYEKTGTRFEINWNQELLKGLLRLLWK